MPFKDANVSIANASVLYGLSIYTVIPVFWNSQTKSLHLFRSKDHFKRLQNSARIMALDQFDKQWDYEKFLSTMMELLKKNKIEKDSLLRISLFVDAELMGARMHDLEHSLCAFVYPVAPLIPKSGAHLCVSNWRRTPDNAIPSRAKINGSYVNAALMRHEAMLSGFDDAISLDEQGHVAESTVANIFVVQGGKLVTPSTSTDLLEGITRDTVFKLADHFGIEYQQRTIDRSELYIADEIFICGSSMQITPVIKVDHRKIGNGKPGRITREISEAYEKYGRLPEEQHPWRS